MTYVALVTEKYLIIITVYGAHLAVRGVIENVIR